MLVRFTKNSAAAEADTLACVRPDGSTTKGELPRQGILPHDAFHFVVEKTLGWRDALFGQVAAGAALEHVATKLHGEEIAWSTNTQALHSESLVECLQAEQWGGAADPATFAETLVITCRRRGVPPPEITADELAAVRVALRAFGAAWRPLAPGQALERTF
ncbi:MAG: hypothetical protein RLZZ15_523 [Verrucomicrobiota bacterium]|jgi:hypothetical protein